MSGTCGNTDQVLEELPCQGIPKTKPAETVNKELLEKLATNYDVTPSFENTLFKHKVMKHYSLERNELLRCRWRQYVDSIHKRSEEAPFTFPESSDLHFYNGTVRFMRSLTDKYHDHRMKLKPGPGIDWRGQTPIPDELLRQPVNQKDEKRKPVKPKLKTAGKMLPKVLKPNK